MEFPLYWQTDMPLVLFKYVYMCELIMMKKNTRNNRYPFHPLKVDKILSMVLADKEILLVLHGLKSSFPLPKSRFLLLYYSYSRPL